VNCYDFAVCVGVAKPRFDRIVGGVDGWDGSIGVGTTRL
jgi:hypothetical protein